LIKSAKNKGERTSGVLLQFFCKIIVALRLGAFFLNFTFYLSKCFFKDTSKLITYIVILLTVVKINLVLTTKKLPMGISGGFKDPVNFLVSMHFFLEKIARSNSN